MSIKETITVQDVIDLLNEALKLDPKAVQDLIESRVTCNENLGLHPSIQVSNYHIKGVLTVGMLGFLNGIFGTAKDDFGCIAAIYQLKCPNGHKGEDLRKNMLGDLCPLCGTSIQLDYISEFKRIR